MARRPLGDPGFADGRRERPLQGRTVQMMTTAYPRTRFHIRPLGRKHPLPGPVDITVGQGPPKRTGKCRSAKSASQVPVELLANSSEVLPKRGNGADRQRNAPILATLAATHEDLPSAEVDVLHSQPQTASRLVDRAGRRLEPVGRTAHAELPAIYDMCVDHRRAQIDVAKELLNRADVDAALE